MGFVRKRNLEKVLWESLKSRIRSTREVWKLETCGQTVETFASDSLRAREDVLEQ